jgi:hypothetical protein
MQLFHYKATAEVGKMSVSLFINYPQRLHTHYTEALTYEATIIPNTLLTMSSRRNTTPARLRHPLSFRDYTTWYHQNNPQQLQDHPLMPEVDLFHDADRYHEYLNNTTFGREPFDRFDSAFYAGRTRDVRSFEFIPDPNPGNLIQSFLGWLHSQEELHDRIRESIAEDMVLIWLREAILGYGDYLDTDGAASHEHLLAFAAARRSIADNERQALNAVSLQSLRPAYSNPRSVRSFYRWAITRYREPTRNMNNSIEHALEADLDGYDQYLEQHATKSQVNDFRRRRDEVANTPYDFVPFDPRVPSYQTWRRLEDERRRRTGEALLASREQILLLYEEQIIARAAEEIYFDFRLSLDSYYEENRRVLYGYDRDAHSPMIERLRGARRDVQDMVMTSDHVWPRDNNPIRQRLEEVNRLFTMRIAMDQEPTREQWGFINASIRVADEIMQEAIAWEGENVNWREIQEGLEGERTPRPPTVVDPFESEAERTPMRERRDFFGRRSPETESEDDFPLL